MRVLVLEDNTRIIELYKKIFAQKGYVADFVDNCESCLDKFVGQQSAYDFVILENPTNLAGGENLEDQIRQSSPQQRIFFLSPYLKQRDPEFNRVKETLDLIDEPFALISLLSYLEIKPIQ